MRTIIIGDVHGCYDELIALLQKVRYRAKKDRLIMLGDLMDRGPYSYEVLQWAIRHKKKNPDTFFMIRGNHEQMLVEQSKALDTRMIWRVVGKTATLRSFAKHKDRMERYIPWILTNMPLYFKEEDYRCVHAAVEYEDLDQNSMELMVKDHSYSKKNLYAGKITIIGHTPLDEPTYYDGGGQSGIFLPYHEWNPLPSNGAICIDTGCVFGDKLTAMILKDSQYYLEYVDSDIEVENKAHRYVGLIKKFCSLPMIRRFCSGSNAR